MSTADMFFDWLEVAATTTDTHPDIVVDAEGLIYTQQSNNRDADEVCRWLQPFGPLGIVESAGAAWDWGLSEPENEDEMIDAYIDCAHDDLRRIFEQEHA